MAIKPSEEQVWRKDYTEAGKNFSFPKNMNVYDLVYEENRKRKDNIAIEYEGKNIRFGDFFDKVDERTDYFKSLGVKPNDIVTMATLSTPNFIYDFYSLGRLGAVSNLIDPRTNIEGIKHYIDEAGSDIIIFNDLFIDKILKAIDDGDYKLISNSLFGDSRLLETPLNIVSVLTGLKSELLRMKDSRIIKYPKTIVTPDTTIPADRKNEDLTIVHTGGTTGIPKGVVLTHDNYNAVAYEYLTSNIGFQPGDKFMIIMPPWISYGSGLLHMTLVGGMTAEIIPKQNGKKMDQTLIKNQPTWFAGVPAHFVNMIDRNIAKGDAFKGIKSGAVGGGATPAELYEEADKYFMDHGCQQGVIPGYGLTECSSTFAARQNADFHPGSVGQPLPGCTVGIFKFDEDTFETVDEELGYNQKGEICVRTPGIMKGYYKNQEMTDKVLRKHKDGKIWLHTGDLGYIDEGGYLFVDGRIKELIIRHDGFKVYPNLIENVILKVNGVESVKVVGVKDPNNNVGDIPRVYFTIKSDFEPYTQQILEKVQEECYKDLSEYYTEGISFEIIDKMPLTPIGKVDYRLLQEQGNAKLQEEHKQKTKRK